MSFAVCTSEVTGTGWGMGRGAVLAENLSILRAAREVVLGQSSLVGREQLSAAQEPGEFAISV